MGVQALSRQACPLSGSAFGFGPTRVRVGACQGSKVPHSFGGTSKIPLLDGRSVVKFCKPFVRPDQKREVVRGAFDRKSGAEGFSGNGQFRCRQRLGTLYQGAKSTLSTSGVVTGSSCHSQQGNRRRRWGKVRAITTDEAYETLADLEKRLDEEGGEYDDEEYYEIVPDKRRAATEPVRKIMDLSWLWLLEELREYPTLNEMVLLAH